MSQLEFRLYYDENGKVICYTSEKFAGNFIVITAEQFAEARPDVCVKNNEIIRTHRASHYFKLAKNDSEGISTSKYDINILTDIDNNFWNMTAYAIK